MPPGLNMISFEGITGVGKSSALERVREDLLACGFRVYVKEDLLHYSGENIGRDIKEILDRYRADDYFRMGHPAIETLLICAKRAWETETAIAGAMEDGAIVLADRDRDTVCALQLVSLLKALPLWSKREIAEWVWAIDAASTPDPNLTFFFECPVEIAVARACRRDGVTVTDGALEFNRKAADAFEVALSLPHKAEIIRVDSHDLDSEATNRIVRKTIHERLRQQL